MKGPILRTYTSSSSSFSTTAFAGATAGDVLFIIFKYALPRLRAEPVLEAGEPSRDVGAGELSGNAILSAGPSDLEEPCMGVSTGVLSAGVDRNGLEF